VKDISHSIALPFIYLFQAFALGMKEGTLLQNGGCPGLRENHLPVAGARFNVVLEEGSPLAARKAAL
jgi:hypothetical protein